MQLESMRTLITSCAAPPCCPSGPNTPALITWKHARQACWACTQPCNIESLSDCKQGSTFIHNTKYWRQSLSDRPGQTVNYHNAATNVQCANQAHCTPSLHTTFSSLTLHIHIQSPYARLGACLLLVCMYVCVCSNSTACRQVACTTPLSGVWLHQAS